MTATLQPTNATPANDTRLNSHAEIPDLIGIAGFLGLQLIAQRATLAGSITQLRAWVDGDATLLQAAADAAQRDPRTVLAALLLSEAANWCYTEPRWRG